jgi:hypothetical protein
MNARIAWFAVTFTTGYTYRFLTGANTGLNG